MKSSNRKSLTDIVDIEHPVIMAPMFLITDAHMMIAALNAGITACIPALNFRKIEDLRSAVHTTRNATKKPFGINLIVNKSNVFLNKQLQLCIDEKIDFVITSLGSPHKVIRQLKEAGIKVFCDVIDLKTALKCQQLGADALIALNSDAGGHLGKINGNKLVVDLVANTDLPIISAGGVATSVQMQEKLSLGAAGISAGTIFIASHEAPISREYKDACVHYGAKDVIISTRLSGSPCTIINTPYVQKIGHKPSILQKIMRLHPLLKKYLKMIVSLKGMSTLRRSAYKGGYKEVWSAGPIIEDIHEISSIQEIVDRLVKPK